MVVHVGQKRGLEGKIAATRDDMVALSENKLNNAIYVLQKPISVNTSQTSHSGDVDNVGAQSDDDRPVHWNRSGE